VVAVFGRVRLGALDDLHFVADRGAVQSRVIVLTQFEDD
jgi:hypothetical protein